jgi:hypothetical protein
MPTRTIPAFPLAVNLDEAERPQLIAAACIALYQSHRTNEIGLWRQRAADWSFPELLLELIHLGIELRTGNQPFHLPMTIHTRGRLHG